MKNKGQENILDTFVTGLEEAIGVKISKLSFEEEWSKSGPDELKKRTLDKFLDKVK